MGRKAGYEHIAPLCQHCHAKLHACGSATRFYDVTDVDVLVAARKTQEAWEEA